MNDFMIDGQNLERQRAYWLARLTSDLPVTTLPYDRPAATSSSPIPQNFEFMIGPGTSERIYKVSRGTSFLSYVSLMSALAICLYRYNGNEMVVMGSPPRQKDPGVAVRPNALVIVIRVGGCESFKELFFAIKAGLTEAYEFEDFPFENLLQDLKRDNGLPLFDIAASLDDFHAPLAVVGNGFTFAFTRSMDTIKGAVTFNGRTHDMATVRQFVGHFIRILDVTLANPKTKIADIEVLSDSERRGILDLSSGALESCVSRCLHEWFEEQAGKFTNRLAVVCGEDQVSYGELNRRANCLAHYLRDRGVGPESVVGLCCQRSIGMMVGLLGVLKAGGAYVALDPGSPRERLVSFMEDSGARILVTQEKLCEKSFRDQYVVICVDSDWDRIALAPAENPAVLLSPENLAQVIYTSGSTGKPKGVAGTHRNVFSYVQAVVRVLAPSQGERFAMLHNLSVDAGITLLWGYLYGGGCLHILTDDCVADPALLGAYFVRHRIDYFKVAPSYLRILFRGTNARDIIPARLLMVGGEASQWALARTARALDPDCIYVNHYGPTETTCGVSTYRVPDESSQADGQSVPMGRPLSNSSLYTTDKNLELVPMGVAGDLLIGGEGLARGYLNRPAETAERFIPDPFSHGAGMRLYRSGDMTRWLGDGHLEFLGRRDTQVKIRGYRIELGEVDVVMVQHPEVVEAVTVMQDEGNGDPRLVVYLVSRGESKPASEWRSYLRSRLPEWMVPSLFVSMEKLPRTPQGKIHHAALPAPVVNEAPGNDGGQSAVTTVTEDLIGNIWCALLNQERIGVDENFFELGGHSLLATQVITRVREAFRVELPLRTLFENPTVAGLAGQVEKARGRNETVALATMVRASRERELPLSFAQQRLWFIDQLEPGSTVYNIPFGVRLSGELNREALLWSMGEIVRRHEVLRTRFPERDGVPVQEIREAWRPEIEEIDLRGLSEREEEARRQAQEEADGAFDLRRGPLLRVKLLRLEEQEHVLLVTVHHIVSDGWSRSVMVREMTALYQAYQEGRPSPLGEMELQYVDYAVWQREWLQGEVLGEQLGYWRRQLAGIEALELPVDHARKGLGKQDGGVVEWELSEELTQEVKELSRREGATLFMTLLAVFQLLLSRHSGQKDVAVGTPMAGRRWQETEGMIGFFVNTLVLRSEIEGREGFRELLKQVRETTLQAYEHQDVPFEKLVEELQPERDLTRTSLFQVMFAWQNMPEKNFELAQLRISQMEDAGEGPAKFDLLLTAGERAGKILGALTFSTGLFTEASVRRMLDHWVNLLREIVGAPDRFLDELQMLGPEEQRQVLEEWNQTESEHLWPNLLELFEQQVEKMREAPAVIHEQSQLSYFDLDCRANQLARYLTKFRVGPEARVGICMDRGLDMIVAVLAVLKAGAAYVPLDPQYPPLRLSYMIEDSQIRVLLTQESLAVSFSGLGSGCVCVDSHWPAIAEESKEKLPLVFEARNLAYVIYTSGSTGNPKGVAMPHGPLTNLILWQLSRDRHPASLRTLQFTSLSFDVSFQEIFATLCGGGTLVLVDEALRRDPAALWRAIREQRVERIFLPFVALQQLAEAAEWAHANQESQPGSLREIITAGEQLKITSVVKRMFERLPACSLENQYGPAETHVVTGFRLEEHCNSWPMLPSIGGPIANTRMYVVGDMCAPAPVGVPGELCLAGDALARGYLNRPELTAATFLPNPFSKESGERMYRSGDVARWRSDGKLEFLGRKDQQVKIRGYRIEPGEIESILTKHPAVREAVVVARGDAETRQLVAYLVGTSSESSPPDLLSYLGGHLPKHMVPAAFCWLDRLPLTPSGKLDRRSLPEVSANHGRPDYVPPCTPVEQAVAGIWAELLHVERVGVKDNFFDLGGHSLLATQVVSRLRNTFQIDIPVSLIFKAPTILELNEAIVAGCLEPENADAAADLVHEIQQLSSEEIKQLLKEEVM
jgi:amino acid adenylation domain-containing protein